MAEPMHALVVDDDPIVRNTVRFALEHEGFQCDVAIDGDDAVRQLVTNHYLLVVTDLRMPNKHGHALSTELLLKNPRPMIVVHSSIDDPKLTKDLLLRGVDDIVYKPTNYAAFAAKMRALVIRRAGLAKSGMPKQQKSGSSEKRRQVEASEPHNEPIAQAISDIPAGTPVPLADLEEKLSLVMRILPVSKAAIDVFEMTRSGCDAPQLGAAISRDAALAAEVLAIANSNFYNPTGKAVTELDKAVVRIGQRRTGELALAASTLSTMTKRQFSWLDMRTMWRQSIAAGVAVELLVAEGNHSKVGENLALIAIMHSLGRVVLGTLYPNHYRQLIHQCEERGEALIHQEDQVFPENHVQVMSRLLTAWNIPDEICRPMNHILDSYTSLSQLAKPTQTKAELIKLAVFVGQVATCAWHSWDLIELPPTSLLKRLQIRDMDTVLEQTRANVQTIIAAQSGANLDQRKKTPPQQIQDTGRKVCYVSTSPHSFDFVRRLIQDMGFEVAAYSAESQQRFPKVLVNEIAQESGGPVAMTHIADDVDTLTLGEGGRLAVEEGGHHDLQFPLDLESFRTALMGISIPATVT